ncbi:MAG: 23S rRNA (adenine(2503)-C(2))-methyltransferase RlmN [Planctomycetaceae bacterium]|nr:23S rRNA (adenine(2503)-C(2))-methyltransferase RlmN [Planctomycetaceae bacterium]
MPFLELEKAQLQNELAELKLPSYRTGQLRRWVFARKTFDFALMTDLPKSVRQQLAAHFGSILQTTTQVRDCASDSTEKLLLALPDGQQIECVLLRDNRGHRTACISTQVGCAMGCVFCASGLGGFVRNLSRGEILEQILLLNSLLPKDERLTHLVVMGIGEPTLNLDALLSALDDATASDGLDLSVRRVTISTVGIPNGIRSLAKSVANTGKEYKLAVSLHAPNDELRTKIMPQNRFAGIAEILSATDDYFAQTGRRVTFEYILIDGVNDRQKHARQLSALLKNKTAVVNLIPFNPVLELPFRTPPEPQVRRFASLLESGGLQVKVRFRKGDTINAACGQLRRNINKIGGD